jgi:spore cortex protein
LIKKLRISVTLLLIFSLMGCGTNNGKNNATENNVGTNTTNEQTNNDNQNQNASNNHKLELADDVAEKIASMDEVENATVIVTNANAYVAVVLKEGIERTEQTENKIADRIRSENTDYNNVYVSVNPDFVNQMTDYRDKITAGEPVEGFFEEFSDVVQRVFPNAH